MSTTRWDGPTVGGVDCNAPETAVWTSVFAAVLASTPEPHDRFENSETMAGAVSHARERADIAIRVLRRQPSGRSR